MDYSDSEEDETPTYDLRTLPKIRGFDQPLSLEINYLPTWTFRDCFREVCQNWADGMRVSNKLRKRNFTVVIEDTGARWLAKALHPDTKVLIGFIRFEAKNGMVELTNFNAQLPRRTLNFGGGDKDDKPYLAGGKGEGYKAAAVVALERGYQFRFEASNCYWTFHVGRRDPDQVYCQLRPMKPKTLEKTIDQYEAKFSGAGPRDTTNYIHEDVSVKIGNVYASKSYPGEKITDTEFRKCIMVSLDLISPAAMITTTHGDLIIDREFKNKTYLKRLLVEGNPGISEYRFGYHFLSGKIDRDRRRMPNTHKDAARVANIWGEVIETHPEYLEEYITMLEDDKTEWSDVSIAKDYVSEDVAKKISEYYFAKDTERNIFYYNSKNGGKEFEIIKKSLKKIPHPLVRTVWDILRKFELVRTPQEQQERLLIDAPEAVDSGTLYSKGVKRALMAALLLSPRTKSIQLTFRSRAKADLDMLLRGQVLNINEKWLDFRASHQKTPCSLSRAVGPEAHNSDCFSCYHVVFHLYRLVLEELARQPGEKIEQAETDNLLQHRVRENLIQMPIMVTANMTENRGEILVSWTDLDSVSKLHQLNSRCRVTLHRESTCSPIKHHLLSLGDVENDSRPKRQSSKPGIHAAAACGCPEQVVLQTDGTALFQGLNHSKYYFPMVSRTDPQAFFGATPESVRPRSHAIQPEDVQPASTSSNDELGGVKSKLTSKAKELQAQMSGESRDIVPSQDRVPFYQDILLGLEISMLKKALSAKEEELRATNLLLEDLMVRESSATDAINILQTKIQRLEAANTELEEDLEIAQEVNNKQAQLAANRAARMRSSTYGVKREREDDDDDAGPGRDRKFARGAGLSAPPSDNIVLD